MPVGGRGADVDSDDEDCFKKVPTVDKEAQEAAPTYLLYGRLTLTVERAELQGTAKYNPYVQLKCGGQNFKTEVDSKGDKAPKWESSYIIELDGSKKADDNILHLYVTDKGTFSSHIGRLDIPLDELFPHKTDGKDKPALELGLVTPKNLTRPAGKIWLKAVWDGRGMPWQSDSDVGGSGREEKKAIMMKGKLTVTVHRSENLRNVQMIGKQDPYVELKFASYTYRTKVHEKGGTSPKWEQDFIFNVDHSQSETFTFFVYDKETMIDNKIGRIDLSIGRLLQKKNKEQMLQLVFWENFHKIAGELYVTVTYIGTGAPITDEDKKAEEEIKRRIYEAEQAKLKEFEQVAKGVEQQANLFIGNLHAQHQAELQKKEEELARQQEAFRKEKEELEASKRELAAQKEAAQREADRVRLQAEAAQKEAERIRLDAESKKAPPAELREESHPHPLKLLPTIYKGQYVCDKCQIRGSGQVYHCDICKFDMHPTCCVQYTEWQGSRPVPIKQTLRDFRHVHDLFKLPSVNQGAYNCVNCKGQKSGEVYHCDLCKWDICPKCFALTT